GGGAVSLSSNNSVPNLPAALTPDTYNLDNGTLIITSLIPNNIGSTNSSFFDPVSTRRGITVGPGGGTFVVTNPIEIIVANGARGTTMASGGGEVRNSLTWRYAGQSAGSGDLKKNGTGSWIVTNPLNSGYTGNITQTADTIDVRDNSVLGTGKITFDPQFPI